MYRGTHGECADSTQLKLSLRGRTPEEQRTLLAGYGASVDMGLAQMCEWLGLNETERKIILEG